MILSPPTSAHHSAGRIGRPVLAVLLLGVGCSPTGPETPNSPAAACSQAAVPYPDELPQTGSVERVHDPSIVKQGDTYYVFSTNDGTPIRRSRDLIQWEWVGRVFDDQLPPWAQGEVPGVRAPWAPDVSFFNGQYHLFYSLSTFGSQRSVIGLATNTTLNPSSAEYRWEDQGKVLESSPGASDYNAIDPNVVFDEQGEPWLAWGSFWGGIKMRKLDAATGKLSSADTVQYSLASRPVAGGAVEAPALLRHGDFFYLFVSFDSCCRGAASTYNVRVGRSRSITGPYVDRDGVPLMEGGGTLVLGGYGRIRGPGHNSILSENGRDLLVHHFYDAEDDGVSKLQIRPLVWTEEGWPVAGSPLEQGDLGPAPADPDLTGEWGYWRNDAPPRRLQLLQNGRFEQCDGEGTWSYSAPWLTLQWTSAGAVGGIRTEKVHLSGDGEEFVGRTEDGRVIRGYRIDS